MTTTMKKATIAQETNVVHPFIANEETHKVQYRFSVDLLRFLMKKYHPMNRPADKARINAIRADLRHNAWFVKSGNCIKFDIFGNVIDGRHRIESHIAEEIPMISSVIYGLPVEAINCQDRNRHRSSAQNAVLLQHRLSETLPTDDDFKVVGLTYRIAKWYAIGIKWMNGESKPKARLSDSETAAFIEAHLPEIKFAQDAALSRHTNKPGFLSALAIYYTKHPRQAVEFRHQILRGVNATEAVVSLRDYLMVKKEGGNSTDYDHHNTVHAINCFHAGKSVSQKFPQNHRTSWAV